MVKGRCLRLYLCLRCAPCSAHKGCVPSLESSVLAVRSQAGLSGKGKPSALGRAHLTFASTEFRSPLGGSVGSAAKQSTGCHEQDLSASGREGLGWGSDLWSRGEEETADPPTCKFRGDQLNLMRNAASALSKNTPSGMVWADGPTGTSRSKRGTCLARSK